VTDFVYSAGADRIDLSPEFDTLLFPREGATFPASPIVLAGFQAGPTGDRIYLGGWLEAVTGRWSHEYNPFALGFLKLEQDGDDAVLLVDLDGQIDWEGVGFVPWLRFEGIQASALAAENFGYDPASLTSWEGVRKYATGSDADELIVGLDLYNELDGGGGDDRLVGGANTNHLRGGDGDDLLQGRDRNDSLYGEDGADRIEGRGGNDSIQGGAGNDLLLGGDGDDWLSDGSGDDRLEGGAGADYLSSSEGRDLLIGGAGNDSLYLSRYSTQIVEQNRLEGGEGDDHLTVRLQSAGLAELDGGTGSDTVNIGLLHDRLAIRFDPDGTDRIVLDQFQGHWYWKSKISVDGFARGDSGAVLVWDDFLGRVLTGWDGSANPFAAGFARIVTIEGRQILQVDANGGADSWTRVMDLGLDTGEAFTAFNFDGFAPDGSDPVGQTVAGTSGPDELAGHNGSDVLEGRDSADRIFGRAGADSISGGGGDDRIEGGSGADLIDGGQGNDHIEGGAGDDVVHGGEGNDSIEDNMVSGAGGNDSLYGDGGDDFILIYREWPQPAGTYHVSGGDGADRMIVAISSGGTATVDAGPGDDIVQVSTLRSGSAMVVTLGEGRDTLQVDSGRFHVASTSSLGVTDFAAGALGDRIDFGNSFAEWFTGWTAGSNPFASGHLGLVPFEGGARLRIDSNGGGDSFITLLTLDGVDPLALTSENLGGFAPPTATFTDGADQIAGTAGSDLVRGLAGADVFRLHQGGDDAASGGDGGDTFHLGSALTGADRIDGGAGTDTLVLQGDYSGGLDLGANVTAIENVSLLAGSNTNLGEPGTNRYDYVLTTHDSNFASGVQARINAAALLEGEDFTFDGSAETDALYVVYGGKGKDMLTGGLGNDIFFYAEERFASGDTVNGGAGYDGMFLRGNYTIDFNAPGYTGLFTNIENLTLTSATDERYARGGGTEFDYNLTLSNAIVNAGQTLTISGSLLMASELMVLDASQESDGLLRLFGGKANDTLKGGNQSDLIHGNLGADTLAGNGGADTFRFDSAADSSAASMDQILDFAAGTDKIDLSRVDSNAGAAGDQAFSWIGSNAFTGTAGQLRASEQGGTWFVEGDTNGDGAADLVIALTLIGPAALGAGDFLL
jgi:Ca2+-binding RTX toxin-like protein